MSSNEYIQAARKVFEIESQAIQSLSSRIGENFEKAVSLLRDCQGKVIVTGIGKSGIIGRKISSTLSSTGTPSMFIHPAECSHGDLGVVSSKDTILAISYGGESQELSDVLQYCMRKGIPVISMTGKSQSTLAKAGDVVLDISIDKEACPLGLAPTTSTTVTLAMGDAVAVALMKAKGIKEEDFAEFHPGGKLGRRLLTRVKDVMHSGSALPLVQPEDSVREVIVKISHREVQGVAGVVDPEGCLIGVITDGDVRRRLEQGEQLLEEKAKDLMSEHPKTIHQEELAEKALFVMEQFQIQTLFAVEEFSKEKFKPVGLLHIQDLLRAKIR